MRKKYPRRTPLKKFLNYYIPPVNEVADFFLATDKSVYPLILDTINSAKKSLYLSFFQFTINKNHLVGIPLELFSSLKSRQQDGVEIKILLNSKFANGFQKELNKKTLEFLQTNNINVKWTNPKRVNHTKLIIADESLAFIGSANLTITGLADNWEVGITIKSEAIKKILVPFFFKLWEA